MSQAGLLSDSTSLSLAWAQSDPTGLKATALKAHQLGPPIYNATQGTYKVPVAEGPGCNAKQKTANHTVGWKP